MWQFADSDSSSPASKRLQVIAEDVLNASIDSDSDSSSNEPSAKCGRKVLNPVWDYYKRKRNPIKVSICQVRSSNAVKCEHSIKGWYATNAIDHLRRKHEEKYQELAAKLKLINTEKETNEAPLRRTKLDKPLRRKGTKYELQNSKQKRFNTKLAIMFESLNISLSLIEKEEFVDIIEEANERLSLPGRCKLMQSIADLYQRMKDAIEEALLEPKKIALSADIWSQKDLTSTYLTITAHYYSSKDHCLRKVLLGLRPIESTHAAHVSNIIYELLQDWKIPRSKILRILTDNGASTVKTYKDSKDLLRALESLILTVEAETYDSEISYLSIDPYLELSFDEDDKISEEHADPIAEFDENEQSFVNQFGRNMRLSCCEHIVQCVLCETVEKKPEWIIVINKIRSIVNKFSKSSTATQNLVKKAGLILVKTSNTRWNAMYFVAKSLIKIKPDVIKICSDQNWNCLIASEWNTVFFDVFFIYRIGYGYKRRPLLCLTLIRP